MATLLSWLDGAPPWRPRRGEYAPRREIAQGDAGPRRPTAALDRPACRPFPGSVRSRPCDLPTRRPEPSVSRLEEPVSSPIGLYATGALLGLSIVAPPGPVMAVMASASLAGRPRESIVTAVGAMSADAVWMLAVMAGFIAVLRDQPRVVGALGIGGGGLLVWMAWQGFRSARRGIATTSIRGSYRLGFLTVLTSPFSLGWWMASGPIVIASLHWQGIAGLFCSILFYAVLFSYALRWIGARVKAAAIIFAYVGVAMLAGFGVYFAREGWRLLGLG